LYWIDEVGGKINDKRDYKKVEFYASKVANHDAIASFLLGQVYSDGGHGVEKDNNKAFYWWKNGAKLGNASCYDNLGWSYFYGNGVNKNYLKAYESYRNAIKIDSTDAYAYYYIAIMFKR
jgi:TPR repeat protein